MSGDFVNDFVEPLIRLGFAPKGGDIVAIAEALAEDAPKATEYQLKAAVRAIRQSWKYMNFPPHKVCLDAIREAPVREISGDFRRTTVDERPRGEPPMLTTARRFVADYEASDTARRAAMDRAQRGRYDASKAVLAAFDPDWAA